MLGKFVQVYFFKNTFFDILPVFGSAANRRENVEKEMDMTCNAAPTVRQSGAEHEHVLLADMNASERR